METKNKNIKRSLNLKRVIDAPRNIVWEAWTDEDQVQQWWGPKGFTSSVFDWVPKPGNRILIHMQGPDKIIYPMGGEFREVDKPKKLVFIGEALNTEGKTILTSDNIITFSEKRHSTEMTIRVEVTQSTPEAEQALQGMEEGWNQMLDKLEEYIAKHIHAEHEA